MRIGAGWLKTLFFDYQKAMWYVAQADGEYAKIGRFVSPTLLLVTFLKVFGVRIAFWEVPVFLLVVTVAAIWVGKFLTDIGVVDYNTRLGNKVNPELMEILERIKRIEQNGRTDHSLTHQQ